MFKIPNIDSIFTWKTCNFTVQINYFLFFLGSHLTEYYRFFTLHYLKMLCWTLTGCLYSLLDPSDPFQRHKKRFSKKIINLLAQLHFFYKWNIRISNIENKILLRSQETFFSSDLLTRCVLWVDLYVFAQ